MKKAGGAHGDPGPFERRDPPGAPRSAQFTKPFSDFSATARTFFEAGLALKVIFSPVKGFTPSRALVAGFFTTFSFSRPGSVNRPWPRRLFLMMPCSDSKTAPTCFFDSSASFAIVERISDLVGAALFFAIVFSCGFPFWAFVFPNILPALSPVPRGSRVPPAFRVREKQQKNACPLSESRATISQRPRISTSFSGVLIARRRARTRIRAARAQCSDSSAGRIRSFRIIRSSTSRMLTANADRSRPPSGGNARRNGRSSGSTSESSRAPAGLYWPGATQLSTTYRIVANRKSSSAVSTTFTIARNSRLRSGGIPPSWIASSSPECTSSTSTTATTEAVSTRPIGGRTRRSGITSGFVSRTIAWTSGLRKSARTSWHSRRSRKAPTTSRMIESIRKYSSGMVGRRPGSAGIAPEFVGQLARAVRGGRDGARDDSTQVGGLEDRERRGGRAALRRDLGPQRRRVVARLCREARRAGRRVDREPARDGGRQALLHRRGLEQLHQQEEVRRPAAGDRGHGVEVAFRVDPHDAADRLQQLRRRAARALIDPGRRVQRRHARADQRRAVRHRAHDRRTRAEPAGDVGGTDAGGDRDHERAALPRERRERAHDAAQQLRLDRQQPDVGMARGDGIVGLEPEPREACGEPGALFRRGVGDREGRGVRAARAPATDQRACHLAAADHRDPRQGRLRGAHAGRPRGPNRAVPMRMWVAPSRIAASKSELMPIESASSERPSRTRSSRSPRCRAK